MPAELLTPAAGAAPPEPVTGFFGKLPSTGDFVARGLPDGFRKIWDRWITAHLASRQRAGALWPDGGVRFRLMSGGRVAAGVILPSEDSAGRLFPLSLMVIASALPGPERLDPWCDAALDLDLALAPDELWDALDALPGPQGQDPGPVLVLWTPGRAPIAASADDPSEALDLIFGPPDEG